MSKQNKIAFAIIYLVTFAFMLHYNLTHELLNDGVFEFRGYMLNIEEGWLYRYSSINSCLVSIWFPAMIQKITNCDPLVLFRVFPPFFYALMPAFVYLIARRYLGLRDAIVATLVILFSSYIVFFPDVGRVGVALGLLSGLIWALLGKKLLSSIAFAVLVVYAHYGAALVTIGMVLALLVARLLWDRGLIRVTVAALCTLVLFTGAWHFGIAHYSGDSMTKTLLYPNEARVELRDSEGVVVQLPEGDFFELESRDQVTQAALGVGFLTNPAPAKVAVIINWVVVVLITIGLYLSVRRQATDRAFAVLLLAMYCLTAASAIIPAVSVFYGTQRTYFTSLIVLSVCFPVGARWVAGKVHLPSVAVMTLVLAVYGASSAGLVHAVFGMSKTIPVILTMP